MEQEIFKISFDFKRKTYTAEARKVVGTICHRLEHEIWLHGRYLFTVTLDEHFIEGSYWRSNEPRISGEFLRAIGEAIKKHYYL